MAKNKTFILEKTAKINEKNFKFINGCKANKDTHKTAKLFLTSNIYGTYIIAIHLRNSPGPYMRISAQTVDYCANIRSIQYPSMTNFSLFFRNFDFLGIIFPENPVNLAGSKEIPAKMKRWNNS